MSEEFQMPGFRLDNKTALVTGAGRGLGAAIAEAYAASGARVILLGRTQSHLNEVAARIGAAGGQSSVIACDVTDETALRAAIKRIPALDILVNNAGTNFPEPFVEVSDAHLDAMLNLNVRACFTAAQAAVRKMLEDKTRVDKGGCIIHMSSQMGHVGSPNRTVYCMTKHALEGLTKAMAVELAPQNIRVNSIGPTFTDTPLMRKVADTPEKMQFIMERIPIGKLATPGDIAAAAVYLASPAAAMVTGTNLIVDGGWTAQ